MKMKFEASVNCHFGTMLRDIHFHELNIVENREAGAGRECDANISSVAQVDDISDDDDEMMK